MRTLALASIFALTGCGVPQPFDLTINGTHTPTEQERASLRSDGANQVLQVCAEYPTAYALAIDAGGTVCFSVALQVGRLSATSFTIAGRATRAEDGTKTFVARATGSAAVTSAWFDVNCFCDLLTDESLEGTLTLHHVDAQRLVGEFSITATSGDRTFALRASFDVSG